MINIKYLQTVELEDRIDYYEEALNTLIEAERAGIDIKKADAYLLWYKNKKLMEKRDEWEHSRNAVESNGYDIIDSYRAERLLYAIYRMMN